MTRFEKFSKFENQNDTRHIKAYLLQLEARKSSVSSQVPFHRFGIGPIPLSLKLLDSGQIPDNHPHPPRKKKENSLISTDNVIFTMTFTLIILFACRLINFICINTCIN